MRNTRDSFLRFLADNLPDIPVNNVRKDKSSPEESRGLVMNALNVEFMNMNFDTSISSTSVVLDLVNDDELIAIDWAEKVWSLLSARFYTEKLDYTDPTNPVPTGYNVMWDRTSVKFRPISSPMYYHLHAQFMLKHYTK